MGDFKTIFNPLIPLGRFAISLFFGGLTCSLIYLLFSNYMINGIKEYLMIIIGVIIFGLFFQFFFGTFIKTTKNYFIKDDSIDEFNVLTFKTRTIDRDSVMGFSTSMVSYRIWNFKQIIIYLEDGTKIDIMQFAYFNFKSIKPVLIEKKYNDFGYEPYTWKWINGRVYKYDKVGT